KEDQKMALSIHTNYSALTTNTALNKSNNALATNQQRLGTGLRINSAADDAAGLQIATRLNAQSRGMGVAMRNTSDAISMLQTAEGAFSEMTDIMQRMKDLATQGANGTNTADDKAALQAEYDELAKEIRNVLKNTKYAGEELFSVKKADSKFDAAIAFQIGASASETLTIDLSATGNGALHTAVDEIVKIADTLIIDADPAATVKGTQVGAAATITLVENALDK